MCYCGDLRPVESRTRVVILQHPRERRVAIGTARMAHLLLPNSELHVGTRFDEHPRLRTLAAQAGVAVLFPDDEATTASAAASGASGVSGCVSEGVSTAAPHTIIVVDGTWSTARKVLMRSPLLCALPRIGLAPSRPSNYRIRREPSESCVSTIEAVVEVLGILERDEARFRPMLAVFDRMIDTQIERAAARTGPPRRKHKRQASSDGGPKPLPSPWPADRYRDLVLLHAEANAHPRYGGRPGEAELVQLVALRVEGGERFEAVVAPRMPLAKNTSLHLELDAARFLVGEPAAEARARFGVFLRDDDLYVVWGRYGLELLHAEGYPDRPAIDLRPAVSRQLLRKPGGVEQASRLFDDLGGDLSGEGKIAAPWAAGRAGRRILELSSLVVRFADGRPLAVALDRPRKKKLP